MKRVSFFLIVLICLTVAGYAQTRGPFTSAKNKSETTPCRKNAKLVDADKPIVFLSFIRRATVKVSGVDGEGDRLFFKLTNNFCSPVVLDMSGEHEGWGDVSLYYSIEDKGSGRRISGTLHCHVCSTNPLSPGRSIAFSIPFDQADRGAVMRVAYEFEFDRDGRYESSNSLHTVAYYFSGLPESVLPKLTFR